MSGHGCDNMVSMSEENGRDWYGSTRIFPDMHVVLTCSSAPRERTTEYCYIMKFTSLAIVQVLRLRGECLDE